MRLLRGIALGSMLAVAAINTSCGSGGPAASDEPLQRSIVRCVGNDGFETAEARYLGLRIEDLEQAARADGHVLRVIGEDADCFDRRDDLRSDRLNVFMHDDLSVWAGFG